MTTETPKISKLKVEDFEKLVSYLNNLTQETRSRFEPHAFDMASVKQFYLPKNNNCGYILILNDSETNEIIAYSIIKKGYVSKDKTRLENYGVSLYPETDCTFAPSVADAWQSKGLGKIMFDFIKNDLQKQGFKRIILWGGVQASNVRAVNYYLKYNFRKVGEFENKGIENYDMVMELT